MNKIYLDQIEKAKSLVAGVQKQKDALQQKGITVEVSKLTSLQQALIESSKKQEDAEQQLKKLRDEAHSCLETLKNACNELKVPIKNNFPIEQWCNFGIPDKR
ncbi:MAG: hypothetical protein K5860_03125 [Bacteroidales bacterium]|nr:hypothetical protein [Bacteroidales bacterium]MBR4497933.1 hypothetical protein [Bacteroidales bacterium]MBR4690983.1 hypothetical protein [Bacteroidales bacterium]MBR7034252.1 hypothetical protein [Bacteroidales bacterium]MCR4799478.1 hypothetical protein [Bacteroidales bacterium]